MGRTTNVPEGFYSAAQAIKKLRIPRSSFYDMVEKGKIEKITPPHRSDGYYRKAQIDDMVRAQEMFILQYATKNAIFERATPDDALGIYDVGVSLWGTAGTPTVETRLDWYKSNPDIDYVVKQEGVVTGYVSLMPLKHETIEQLLSGEKRGWEVTPDELLPFTPGVPLEGFIMAIGVRAGLQKPEKYGMRLLAGSVHVLGELAEKGVIFKKLYATSNSPDGIKVCRDLGFEEFDDPIPGSTRKRFVMDVATSHSMLLEEYHEVIRKQHSKQAKKASSQKGTTMNLTQLATP
jgi:hypothetical protein